MRGSLAVQERGKRAEKKHESNPLLSPPSGWINTSFKCILPRSPASSCHLETSSFLRTASKKVTPPHSTPPPVPAVWFLISPHLIANATVRPVPRRAPVLTSFIRIIKLSHCHPVLLQTQCANKTPENEH